MSEKVAELGIVKEKGFLYFLDKEGDVSRAKMVRKGNTQPVDPPEKIKTAGVTREKGFLYFIDKEGDVARAPMKRKKG